MTTDFEKEIKNYLFNVPCIKCNDYLFLLHMKKVDEKNVNVSLHLPQNFVTASGEKGTPYGLETTNITSDNKIR